MNDFIQFDILDFLDRKSWPRVVPRRFYEINPLGQIRYLDTKRMKNVNHKPMKFNGELYFMAVAGWAHGNLIVVRIPIKDLVKRFFSK